MNRSRVLCALILALLASHAALAAGESWIPADIRSIVASNPDVWICQPDDRPDGDLADLNSKQEYLTQFHSLIATQLKTAVSVSADEKRGLFAILLEPSNYVDPTEPLNMVMNPPNLECIFKTRNGAMMMSVGNWCFQLFSEYGYDGWHIFSHKGATAFAHWQHDVIAASNTSRIKSQPQFSPRDVQYVTIRGDDVRASGRIEWTPDLTLTAAVAAGGGTSGNPNVYLIRGKERTQVRLKRIERKQDPDLKLQPGDVVEVDDGTY